MPTIGYKEAGPGDVQAMAQIRAEDWGSKEYWSIRIAQYLAHESCPREALRPRVAFLASQGTQPVGLIAGHLTKRFDCDGELEWISVVARYRGCGVALRLLQLLTKWFLAHDARRVCVNVEPTNQWARRFYASHGAEELKPHWMIWTDVRKTLRSCSPARIVKAKRRTVNSQDDGRDSRFPARDPQG